jgi:hypothetical protein
MASFSEQLERAEFVKGLAGKGSAIDLTLNLIMSTQENQKNQHS